MDNKDLTEFGRREAMSYKDVKDDKDNAHAHAKRYKYSPKKLDSIKQSLHGGASISGACGAAGISVKTFYRWKDEIPEFREMVEASQAAAEKALLKKILASEDWRAAAWILERRYPDEWAKRQEHEVIIEKKSSEDVVKSMLVNIIQKENLES
jgi:transposase